MIEQKEARPAIGEIYFCVIFDFNFFVGFFFSIIFQKFQMVLYIFPNFGGVKGRKTCYELRLQIRKHLCITIYIHMHGLLYIYRYIEFELGWITGNGGRRGR